MQQKKLTLMISLVLALSLSLSPHIALATQLPPDDQSIETRNEERANNTVVPGSSRDRSTSTVKDKASILHRVANSAKSVYSLVKAGQWSEARKQLSSLQTIARSLPVNPTFTRQEIAKLSSWIVPLESLIAVKQPLAMDMANQLAMVASQLAIQPNSRLPIEVVMLDYYGRELEIWSTRGNPVKLKTVANKITQIWHDLRPAMQAERSFIQVQPLEDTLVALLDEANSPAEYRLLSAPLLAEVNQLQAVFLRA